MLFFVFILKEGLTSPYDDRFSSALQYQSGSFMNGCKKKTVFLFHVNIYFLAFLRGGVRDAPASENGRKIVSHGEQSL